MPSSAAGDRDAVLPASRLQTVGSKATTAARGRLALPSSSAEGTGAFAGGIEDDVSLALKLTSFSAREHEARHGRRVAAFKGNMIGGALTFPVTLIRWSFGVPEQSITKVSF